MQIDLTPVRRAPAEDAAAIAIGNRQWSHCAGSTIGAPHDHRWVLVKNNLTIPTHQCAQCGTVELFVRRKWLRLDQPARRVVAA